MAASNRLEAMVQAFRDATGATYKEDQRSTVERLKQASGFRRILNEVWIYGGNVEDYDREYSLREGGRHRLLDLIDAEPGVYIRSKIFYVIMSDYHDNEESFNYDIVFPGDSIGEKGEFRMTYDPSKVWLKGGAESVIEIVGRKGHVLHLPEGEGIILANRKREPFGWSSKWENYGFATWYPDLSETPQPFSHPDRGRIIWNNVQDKLES